MGAIRKDKERVLRVVKLAARHGSLWIEFHEEGIYKL
jgi:hypothetical protein